MLRISVEFRKKEQEVRLLLNEINACKGYSLILSDFNGICGSSPFVLIEQFGFTDSWWKGGDGATFIINWPYRIDHIFFKEGIEFKSIKIINCEDFSDHNALSADFLIE